MYDPMAKVGSKGALILTTKLQKLERIEQSRNVIFYLSVTIELSPGKHRFYFLSEPE